ncbi:MAG: choice-of-anchor E domain-containing protein [Pseudomonadota bacterium]
MIKTTVLALMATAAATSASALTTTSADSFGFLLTELDSTFDGPLELEKFDGTLGTLTGADIVYTIEVQSTGSVTNNSRRPESLSTSVSIQASFFDDDALGLALPRGVTASVSEGPTSVDPRGSIEFDLTASQNDTLAQTALAALTDADGGAGGLEIFRLGFLTDTDFLATGTGGQISSSQTTVARISAAISYTYDAPAPVPLPASGVLLLAGLAGMGIARRRAR